MIDGKSHFIASEMNDIFARIGWHTAPLTTSPMRDSSPQTIKSLP